MRAVEGEADGLDVQRRQKPPHLALPYEQASELASRGLNDGCLCLILRPSALDYPGTGKQLREGMGSCCERARNGQEGEGDGWFDEEHITV